MKNLDIYKLGHPKYGVLRIFSSHYGHPGDETCECFLMYNGKRQLRIIASSGSGWEHVSVSKDYEIPTWSDMCDVKHAFFNEDEWVVQFHPPRAEYVNNHQYCLHLFRPINVKLPTPPTILVGIKDGNITA